VSEIAISSCSDDQLIEENRKALEKMLGELHVNDKLVALRLAGC
jgi:hypothetical protein